MDDSDLHDSPPCRETLDELEGLWQSLSEISPGGGEMPATLKDFTNVQADAQVIEDTSKAFDRLVSLKSRTQSLADMTQKISENPKVQAAMVGGAVVGAAALAFGLNQGYIPAHPVHYDSLSDSFDNSPLTTTGIVGGTIVTSAMLANEVLSRGYARYAGLGDAVNRLSDGATPYADALGDQLSETERTTYGEILRMGYEVSASNDEITQQRFMERIHSTMKTVVSNLESTPQAGMIQETLDGLRDALAGHPSQTEMNHDNDSLDIRPTAASAPSF